MCFPKRSNYQLANLLQILAIMYFLLLLSGCEDQYTPKPKAYFRIDLPEKSYRAYNSALCPFKFEYPVYAEVVRDSLFFDQKAENPCWMNINFNSLKGKIHISYKEVNAENTLSKLIEDSHKLTFKHTIKADYIDEGQISTPNDVYGILYEVGGNAASSVQFYVTDSVNHYLRGSLYFSSAPNQDSLAPVINFVKQDLLHLVNTLSWKE